MPIVGLVLPTSSYRGPDFVAAADELGVDLVIATDGDFGFPGGRILRVVSVDCSDPPRAAEQLIAETVDLSLEAVVGVDDAGVMAAAIAAEMLGLPHNPPEAVRATRDKASMRQMLEEADVAQAKHARVVDVEAAQTAATDIGYPVVIKPLSLSASRGVIKADDASELDTAWRRLASIREEAGLADEPVLVEEYLAGPEVAVEGLMSSDGLEVLAIFDKPDPLDGPFFEETIYVSPSRHAAESLEGVRRLVEQAVGALGLAFGPVHAEVRLTPSGPRLIEVAARSIGGLCGRSLQFGMLAQSLEVLLLRAALGLNRRGMRPVRQASGAMMIPIPAAGVLRGVRGTEAVSEVEGITEITITVPINRRILPLPEGDRYLGFLIARGDDPSDVESALREAHGLLTIDIAPD